jgi:hypothetical protein
MSTMYSAHHSPAKSHLLEIDEWGSRLQITLTRNVDGEAIVGEFELSEAEEIAASIASVCRDIRKRWGER